MHVPACVFLIGIIGSPDAGRPVMHSIGMATKFVYDIEIQEVIEKRAQILCWSDIIKLWLCSECSSCHFVGNSLYVQPQS